MTGGVYLPELAQPGIAEMMGLGKGMHPDGLLIHHAMLDDRVSRNPGADNMADSRRVTKGLNEAPWSRLCVNMAKCCRSVPIFVVYLMLTHSCYFVAA